MLRYNKDKVSKKLVNLQSLYKKVKIGKKVIKEIGKIMDIKLTLPEINIEEKELKLLLAIKLFEERIVSLGKASEIAGYSEKTFSEILLRRGIPPIRFEKEDLEEDINNA